MQTTSIAPTADSTRRATTTMYVGLALSALLAGLTVVDQATVGGITDEMWKEYPDYTAGEVDTEAGATAAALYVLAGLGIACWSWLAVATRRGWRHTRWVATTVLALALVASASMSYVPMPSYLASAMWLPCIAGIVALTMLWLRKPATR
ncbi:hypothetical protein [Solicola gregarius]|uniref:Uncharacterized protein n=1 Tax=Solicola gregarius TaxID=2908642 RepID=A0AA46TGC7_9ACTN|nr:hypothetical protein [Solicola gregarius]UYM04339.1 hypothetical protein L0C25_17615 [Solicola gregarius]